MCATLVATLLITELLLGLCVCVFPLTSIMAAYDYVRCV